MCWRIEMLVWFVYLFGFFFCVCLFVRKNQGGRLMSRALNSQHWKNNRVVRLFDLNLRLFLLLFYPCQSPSHTNQFEICVKTGGNYQLPSELLICPILLMMYILVLLVYSIVILTTLKQLRHTKICLS